MKRLLYLSMLVLAALLAGRARAATRPCDFSGPEAGGRSADDLAVYWPESGQWYVQTLGGQTVVNGIPWGTSAVTPAPGDYDGDGKADLAVYFRDLGTWYIRTIAGATLTFGSNWGWNETVPVPGDYDGDGKTDLAVFHRDTGTWYIRALAGGVIAAGLNWGWSSAIPVPADYDGDGKTDLGIYHRATGKWYIRTLAGAVLAWGLDWGWDETWPAPADYDGDGCADLAVYYRAGGYWYIYSLKGKLLANGLNWGWKGGTPTPGDYNGDGRADLAIYDRSTGNWYIQSLDGTVLALARKWGGLGAAPAELYAQPGADGVAVFSFGDSITWGGGSSSDGPATGYPLLLEKKLNSMWGGYFRSINAGRPGERTTEGYTRLKATLPNVESDVMILMEGMNDALYDSMFRYTADNLWNMAVFGLYRNQRVIMATITPVVTTEQNNRDAQYDRIRKFNPTIQSIGKELACPVADQFKAISSVPGWPSNLIERVSGNHPNDAGYQRVRDAFYNTLSAELLSGSVY